MEIRSVVLRKVINRQTATQKDKKTDKRLVKHNLLGGGGLAIYSPVIVGFVQVLIISLETNSGWKLRPSWIRHPYYKRYKENELTDVTSHIFAQTTHVALPPPTLSCEVGSGTQSTMPSFIKIG